MFGVGNAFWCNGKEIVHFDAGDVVDLPTPQAASVGRDVLAAAQALDAIATVAFVGLGPEARSPHRY